MTRLAHQLDKLAYEPTPAAAEGRRAAMKLAVALCACRATVARLEAQNTGQREALIVLNRHEGLAKDFAAVRAAERTACAQLMDQLAFAIGAKAIRERK